ESRQPLIRASLPKAEFLQVCRDRRVQPRRFCLLFPELLRKSVHLFSERLAVVFRCLCADVTSGREHMAVLADVLDAGVEAKAWDVCIFAGVSVATPGMIGPGDLRDLVVDQLSVNAIDQRPHLASIDEQRSTAAVAKSAIPFIAGEKPQADGNLCRIEKLTRQ